MPGFPVPFIKFREDDANGHPLAGGKVYSYAAGTNNPLPTYTTDNVQVGNGAVPNTNPVILDASGRASIFIADGVGYKFVCTDALGNQQWTVDNVQVPQIAVAPVAAEVPAGGIIAYGGIAAPTGWLLCDGASYSTAAPYDKLFAAISISYGGAGGASTFQVPDLRERLPLGKALSGVAATMGFKDGTLKHVHKGPSHTHLIDAHTHDLPRHQHPVPHNGWPTAFQVAPAPETLITGGGGSAGNAVNLFQAIAGISTGDNPAATTGNPTAPGLVTKPGGDLDTQGADPPYLVVNYIIKM